MESIYRYSLLFWFLIAFLLFGNIKLSNGLIIAPSSIEYVEIPTVGKNKWNSFVDISSDGVSWQLQDFIPADVNLIQPEIWETNEGIYVFMRSDYWLRL